MVFLETQALEEIVNLLGRVHKLDLSVFEHTFLSKSVEKRMGALNISDLGVYTGLLKNDKGEALMLYDSMNICYTEFFRNPLTFALLEQLVLPHLIEERNSNTGIRIWSAGCSTGQEPYSIAMKLDEIIRMKEKKVQFRIFATDLSEKALSAAREGIYTLSDVQDISLKRISRYFNVSKSVYRINGTLKDNIDFSHHDFLDSVSVSPAASIFGGFDLVFCCNVLFYYKQEIRNGILNKLYQSLSPGGYLVTGEAEREIVAKTRLRPVAPPAAVFQKSR
ncbi:MAG: protein-glutamate O-methyltransferase CheR [Bacteroidota bacterium]